MQDALIKPTESQYDLLIKKMQYLIEMGNGETILEVGAGEGNYWLNKNPNNKYDFHYLKKCLCVYNKVRKVD